MKKLIGTTLLVLLLAVMSACNNEEPAEEPATAPVQEPAEEATTEPAEDPATTPETEPADEGEPAPAEEAKDEAAEDTVSAVSGDEVFQQSCITCHSSGDIAGGQGKIDRAKIHADFKTQEELLAFVSETMPKSAPGSLSQEEYEAVVNYLWDQK